MGIIAGKINFKNPLGNNEQEKIITAVSGKHFCKPKIYKNKKACLGKNEFTHNAYNNYILEKDNYILIGDIRLYNLIELKKRFSNLSDLKQTEVVLELYLKFGTNSIKYLSGDFAYVIFNTEKNEIFAARDHFGVRPFYFSLSKESFSFASRFLYFCDKEHKQIDRHWIADLLSFTNSEKDRSFLHEIKRLKPGHFMFIQNGKLLYKEYWNLKKKKVSKANESYFIDEYKRLFQRSIKCRITNSKIIGSEISGGIDSTSIASIALNKINRDQQLKLYSHALEIEDLKKIYPYVDEREHIETFLIYSKNNKNHKYITGKDKGILGSIRYDNLIYGAPTLQNLQLVNDVLYQEVMKDRVEVLFSGFGGDEMVTSQAHGFEKELIRRFQFLKLFRLLKTKNINFIGKLSKIVKGYLPIYLIHYKRRLDSSFYLNKKLDSLAINKEFKKNINIKKRAFKLSGILPYPNVSKRQYKRLFHQHLPHRLEYCQNMAYEFGFDYVYPMLDVDLIEFYYAIPKEFKRNNNWGRYIHRKSMENLLPKNLQWRNDKTRVAIPHTFKRILNDKQKIIKLIQKGNEEKIAIEYIDYDKLEKWANNIFSTKKITYENFTYHPIFINYLKLILYFMDKDSN